MIYIFIASQEEHGNSKFIFLITLTPLVALLILSFIWSKKLNLESRNKPTILDKMFGRKQRDTIKLGKTSKI